VGRPAVGAGLRRRQRVVVHGAGRDVTGGLRTHTTPRLEHDPRLEHVPGVAVELGRHPGTRLGRLDQHVDTFAVWKRTSLTPQP
jgi:hypothetical protein